MWNWLIEETHRVSVAGVYRQFPTPVCSAAASRHVVRDHQRGSRQRRGTRRSPAQVVNRAQSER